MSETQALAPDDVRARLDELVTGWGADGPAQITMLERDGEITGLSVFGLVAHSHSLARAVAVLDSSGEGAQIVPLVRQLLECSVTAMWVEAYGKRAALKIQREEARSRVAVFKQYVQTGLPDDGSTTRWADEQAKLEPLTTRASEKLYERCDELDLGGRAYAMFRSLSALSHAGGMVIDLYCEATTPDAEEPEGGLALSAHPKDWAHEAVMGVALIYLLHAAMAWDRCEKDHPRRTRLKQVAAEMGMRLAWNQTAVGQRRQSEWDRSQKPPRRGLVHE